MALKVCLKTELPKKKKLIICRILTSMFLWNLDRFPRRSDCDRTDPRQELMHILYVTSQKTRPAILLTIIFKPSVKYSNLKMLWTLWSQEHEPACKTQKSLLEEQCVLGIFCDACKRMYAVLFCPRWHFSAVYSRTICLFCCFSVSEEDFGWVLCCVMKWWPFVS